MLITICGIDGSGKTTAGKILRDELESRLTQSLGRPAQVEHTQLLGQANAVIRYYKYLITVDSDFDGTSQNYIFAFERVRTAEDVLVGLLDEKDAVVVDRYVYCDFAFSRARGRRTDMYYDVLRQVPTPDIGFVVDTPVEIAMERILQRDEPPWQFQENEPLLRRARQEYLGVAEEFGLVVVSGHGALDTTRDEMLTALRERDLIG